MSGEGLDRLAAACGIEREFWDGLGVFRRPGAEPLMAALRMLGVEIDDPDRAGEVLAGVCHQQRSRMLEPCLLSWDHKPFCVPICLPDGQGGDFSLVIEREDGGEHAQTGSIDELEVTSRDDGFVVRSLWIDPHLPLGYHDLRVQVGDRVGHSVVIAAPNRVSRPPEVMPRRWGVFAPLYALRGGEHAGDLGDARELAAWMCDRGGRVLGTLPLLATFLDEPFEPSPYAPVSRMFWNELYLDLAELGAEPLLRSRHCALVDYRAAMATKRARLEPLAAAAWDRDRASIEAYIEERPAVADYAAFRATCERQRATFGHWPERQRGGDLREGDYDEVARRYHIWVQQQLHRQLAALGRKVELYLDLPVGVSCWGYDLWRHGEVFARGGSVGAPPDGLFSAGQNWGLPPLHPERQRQGGYSYYRACIRAHLEHASLLRVDHVMGLHRLYWVPEGMPATDGVYIQYPAGELYAVLCLEEHRSGGAEICGEDLGTVPDYVRPAMERHGFNRLYVGQFCLPSEPGGAIAAPPRNSVASLNTHDTPTFAGFWRGAEIDDRQKMGLLDSERVEHEHAEREQLIDATCATLGVPKEPRAAMEALTRQMASSEARVTLVTLEDLWLEPEPQNVPGTGAERPNWRRRMARTLGEITGDPEIAGLADELGALRRD